MGTGEWLCCPAGPAEPRSGREYPMSCGLWGQKSVASLPTLYPSGLVSNRCLIHIAWNEMNECHPKLSS